MFFDTFQRATTVTALLRCESGLRVGAGRSVEQIGTDLPVLRDASGRPYLPGASLKGVLRSQAEALLRAWGLDACDPFTNPCIRDTPPSDGRSAAERTRLRREQVRSHACVACRVFGAPSLASHVVFADAVPEGDVVTEIRDGVAIDRDLGRVSGARKYDYEVVPAGTRFRLRIVMNDLADWGEGLVAAVLDHLDAGFVRVGGFKSRGLGLVSLHEQHVDVLEGAALERTQPGWDDWTEARLAALAARREQGASEPATRPEEVR